MKRPLALAVLFALVGAVLIPQPLFAGNHRSPRDVSSSAGTTDAANFGELRSGVPNPSPTVDPPAKGADPSINNTTAAGGGGPCVAGEDVFVETADGSGCIDLP
jgi:hypothetical protein